MINLEQTLGTDLDQLRVPVPLWAWFVVALAVSALYVLALENGSVLRAGATTLHELFHDGRHFIGVPCH